MNPNLRYNPGTMAKKKKRELTPRRARLIKEMLKGKTLAKAGVSAGYSPKNPAQSAFQALSQMQQSMPEVMHRLGLTRENLIEKHLKPLLRARRVKYFAHHGKVKDSRKVEALEIRCNALDMAFRLEGSYAAPKADTQEIKTVSCIVLDVPRPPRPGMPEGPATIKIEPTSSSVTSPVRDAAANRNREPLPPAK
jgi:hypothetical protein